MRCLLEVRVRSRNRFASTQRGCQQRTATKTGRWPTLALGPPGPGSLGGTSSPRSVFLDVGAGRAYRRSTRSARATPEVRHEDGDHRHGQGHLRGGPGERRFLGGAGGAERPTPLAGGRPLRGGLDGGALALGGRRALVAA